MNIMLLLQLHRADDSKQGAAGDESLRKEAESLAKDLGNFLSDDKKKTEQLEQERAKPKRKIPYRLIILIALLACAVLYYFINPPLYPRIGAPYSDGAPKQYSAAYTKALDALWQFKDAANKFAAAKEGKQPTKIDDFYEMKPELPKTCPISGKPFVFTVLPDGGWTLAAPDPKAAGVDSMMISSKSSVPKVSP